MGMAVVCTLAASLPASGSVRAKALIHSPLAISAAMRLLLGVPNSTKARGPIEWWALTNRAVLAQWPPSTSIKRQ